MKKAFILLGAIIIFIVYLTYSIIAFKINYISFGDSLAKGYPYYLKNQNFSYTDLINSQINSYGFLKDHVTFKNYGVSGFTSSHLVNQISKPGMDFEIKKADIITINIGGNDILQAINSSKSIDYKTILTAAEKYSSNLSIIFSTIRKHNPGVLVYVSNLYNPGIQETNNFSNNDADFLTSYINSSISNLALAYNIKVIDISQIFKEHEYASKAPLFSDYIHPNKEGYLKMSKPFVKSIINDFTLKYCITIIFKHLFHF